MNIGRKILILIIVVLFSYIIYSLMQYRRTIISSINEYKSKKMQIEGFNTEDDDPNKDAIEADIKSISNKILVQIDNENKPIIYKNYDSLNDPKPIKDMFIKASYNSAFTGRYLSSKMVKFCLSQGCRFLDFEVDVSDSIVVVTCTNTNGINKTVTGSKNPAFLDILQCTLDAAFRLNSGSKYPITNVNDPLFINIRCSQSKYDTNVYPLLQKLMSDDNYKSYLDFTSNTTNFINYDNTPPTMQSLKNKAIIMFCSTDNVVSTIEKSSNIGYYLTDTTGRHPQTYSDIIPKKTVNNSNSFVFVFSDPTYLDQISSNPDVFTSIKDWGYNTTCISYYNYYKNAYLTQNERKYENMFIDFNYSFIPMNSLKSYISTHPLYVKP